MSKENQDIQLAEMIQTLRNELQESMVNATSQALQFSIKDIELELKVAVTREISGKAGIKFWVIDAGGAGSRSTESVHTFKLTLHPKGKGTADVLVNQQVKELQ